MEKPQKIINVSHVITHVVGNAIETRTTCHDWYRMNKMHSGISYLCSPLNRTNNVRDLDKTMLWSGLGPTIADGGDLVPEIYWLLREALETPSMIDSSADPESIRYYSDIQNIWRPGLLQPHFENTYKVKGRVGLLATALGGVPERPNLTLGDRYELCYAVIYKYDHGTAEQLPRKCKMTAPVLPNVDVRGSMLAAHKRLY